MNSRKILQRKTGGGGVSRSRCETFLYENDYSKVSSEETTNNQTEQGRKCRNSLPVYGN